MNKSDRTIRIFIAIVWLVTINFVAFIWHLGDTSLVDETEPLFAEAARQMTVTNNWITPYFNGETRFDKPPLVYWLMAVGYKLWGVNEWAVRLPSAVSAIAISVFGFMTLNRFSVTSPKLVNNYQKEQQLWVAAIIGSGLMALNPHTIIWGRTGVSDMLLSACMSCALFCFFFGYASEAVHKERCYLAFYVLLALAVLTKGPVGIVIPGLIIGCFLLYTGNFLAVCQEMQLLRGAIIFGVITIPWFVLILRENGRVYWDSFFGYHNFERFTDVVNGHAAPWYFYFLIVLGLFAPWSVYLPGAIANMQWWKRKYWLKQPRKDQLTLFAWFWFSCIFIFFSISVTKLPSYVLPLVPASAILVAAYWSDLLSNLKLKRQPLSRSVTLAIALNLVLVIALAVGFYLAPSWVGKDPATPKLSRLVAESSLPISGTLVWGILAIAIAILLFQKKYWQWIITVNLIGFLAFTSFVLLPTTFFIDTHRQVPLTEIATEINQIQQDSEPIFMMGFKKPSLVFYTQKPVSFFKRRSDFRAYLSSSNFDNSGSNTTALIVGRAKDIKKIVNLNIYPEITINNYGVYSLIRLPIKAINLD